MITVVLHARKRPNHRHCHAYDLVLDGETVVSNSRDPEHDLARALLTRGIKGVVSLRDGSTGKPRSRVNIEQAAKWCIGSNLERYKWRPSEASDSSPHAGESGFLATGIPSANFDARRAASFPQENYPNAGARDFV